MIMHSERPLLIRASSFTLITQHPDRTPTKRPHQVLGPRVLFAINKALSSPVIMAWQLEAREKHNRNENHLSYINSSPDSWIYSIQLSSVTTSILYTVRSKKSRR